MDNIFIIDTQFNPTLISENPLFMNDLRGNINNENVVIIKNFISADLISDAKIIVFNWGKSQKIKEPQTYLPNDNYKIIEKGVSPNQKTLHYYNAYNFNNSISHLKSSSLNKIFKSMEDFFNAYTLLGANCEKGDRIKLRPQLIHFQKGGGFLSSHIHKKLPQEIGLILVGSKKGIDYNKCDIGFQKNKEIINTLQVCEIGDLIVFNYGQTHWVESCDIQEKIDENSMDGLWIFTLPYY